MTNNKITTIALDKNIDIAADDKKSMPLRMAALRKICLFGKGYFEGTRERLWIDGLTHITDPIVKKISGVTYTLLCDKRRYNKIEHDRNKSYKTHNEIVINAIQELLMLPPGYFHINTICELQEILRETVGSCKKYRNIKYIDRNSNFIDKEKYQRYKKLDGITKLRLVIIAVLHRQLKALLVNSFFNNSDVNHILSKTRECNKYKVKKMCDYLFGESDSLSYREDDALLRLFTNNKIDLERCIEYIFGTLFRELENIKIEKSPKGRPWSPEKIKKEHKKYLRAEYGGRKCQICGKVFPSKENPDKDGYQKNMPNLNLGAQWECLCGHIAELLYGKILRQAVVAQGKNRADIVVDDGKIRFDKINKITYANKIIEVKLSPLFQQTVISSILKYIDHCSSLEIWSCSDIAKESLGSYLAEQLKYLEAEVVKSKRGVSSASDGYFQSQIVWIKKIKKIVGNKKVILKGWDALLREANKKQNNEKIIKIMRKIVGEYGNSIYEYKGKVKRDLSERKACEISNMKFDEILKG